MENVNGLDAMVIQESKPTTMKNEKTPTPKRPDLSGASTLFLQTAAIAYGGLADTTIRECVDDELQKRDE